ncbi:hypothetical protein [Qipengyuania aquimaris]|uniref:hypothetical protein n=1 Tax=Qipengyuania aquimaris TaxID=255984 RepID=UPI001CD47DD7|nr:hypothetical protein [Qipengyuania aquimaris]MCA0902640.1 hypothetical protein [Qipengyuania aquimaris]
MNAAYLRHLQCLEAARLIVSETGGEESAGPKAILTPEARQIMDTYFHERMKRLAFD